MKISALVDQIKKKRSFLCIGLDTDLDKMPPHLKGTDDAIFQFNKAIIDATHHLAVAYKPNTAFYEAYGIKGWEALKKTIDYLNDNHPEIFTIADAKRGDIGNTSTRYAKAFFDEMGFDAVTVAPYMGRDSIEPFLAFGDKHAIMLALTSNPGAFDFQTKKTESDELYKTVLKTSKTWKNSNNLMYVVGATKADFFAEIRKIIPDAFLLVPGIGAQGGNLEEVCAYGLNENIGILVNSSRGIIYAGSNENFAQAAAAEAGRIQQKMAEILSKLHI